ncbi:MAG: hypothetical protein NC086_05505 [Alistipes sp.]|nr:hypothetical protein [Alistipes sp.]
MKKWKENVLFILVVLLILGGGFYFFATRVPIEYKISEDYTGMEYTPDMELVSDSVKLHINGTYYDYIWERKYDDSFQGEFVISSIPETAEYPAHFSAYDSYLEPNGNKKEVHMWYVMCDDVSGMAIMEKRFSNVFIELNGKYDNILLFPARNQEQAVEVYQELESAIYEKDLFSKSGSKKDIGDRLTLTEDWELEENENRKFTLLYQKKQAASMTGGNDFAYGASSHMIVSNWLGMHAAIVEETRIAETDEGDWIDKVLVNIEPSAAEEINGAKAVQEWHYFYVTSDNAFMDIVLTDEDYMTELEEMLCGQ